MYVHSPRLTYPLCVLLASSLGAFSPADHTPQTQVNKVRSHPTLPTIVTAHEDKFIRFFDSNSGQMQHDMIAHMDAVTGIAMDPNGLYVVSSSECLKCMCVVELTCSPILTLTPHPLPLITHHSWLVGW